MNNKKIIIVDRRGRLANRLIIAAHFISYAIENKVKIYNPHFFEYLPYFQFSHSPYFKVKFSVNSFIHKWITHFLIHFLFFLSNRFPRIVGNYLCLINIAETHDSKNKTFFLNNLNSPPYKDAQLLLIQGWAFRDFNLVQKHASAIRQYFSFNKSVLKKAYNVLDTIRQLDFKATTIGVHVRRTDYKNFQGGKYYYGDQVYINHILHLKKILNDAVFIICSDESTTLNTHLIDTTLYEESRNIAEDMYLLSTCDYIIGPPSTFSGWAAFYGKKKKYHITDPKVLPELSDFEEQYVI